VTALKTAFRTLFYGKLLRDDAIAQIRTESGTIPEVRHLLDFIANSPRGVVGRDRE
jgi:acyl-[acyl carrier protein]--UDP-N-acetylglucosamine O-acyltransferase